ncbi:MAG: beta-lactamase family protein [Saprospiraceae bacterium]|nr:beta-lactamase family protein [Saprospiraceae bacterium]
MNIETSTILPNLAMRLTVVLGLITQCIFGQTPKLEISKIDSIPKNIDSVLSKFNFKQNNPGLSVMVIKDGEVIYKKNIGLSNLQTKTPVTDNTIFNIGSVTKQFTAFCILKLAEEGKLNLDDSIQKYIPKLPYFGEIITLNHLLSNTSGIPDYLEVLALKNQYKKKRLKTEYMLDFYKNYHTLSFKPGTSFSYCNTGYMMLCVIVERVSGTSIEKYAQENIFKPLKMKSAKFTNLESDGMPDGTRSYYLAKNKFKAHKPIQPNAMGATGVFCTIDDYRKWDANFTQPTAATKNIVAKMKQEYFFNNGGNSGYGAGILVKPYKGFLSEEHSGGWNSFLVQFRRLPELGLSVFVASISTSNQPFKICDEITDLFLPKRIPTDPTLKINNYNLSDLNIFTGTYLDANNVIRKIINKNDSLTITNYNDTNKAIQKLIYLHTVGDSIVQFIDGELDTVHFLQKEKRVIGFYWTGSTYFRFKRFYEKLDVSKFNVEKICGNYHSEELKYKFKIKKKGSNQLILKPIFFLNYDFDYLGSNVFKVKNEPIYFRFYNNYVSVGNEWTSNIIIPKVKNK